MLHCNKETVHVRSKMYPPANDPMEYLRIVVVDDELSSRTQWFWGCMLICGEYMYTTYIYI